MKASPDKLRKSKTAAVGIAFIGLTVGYPSSYAATATAFLLPLTREFGWGQIVPSLMYVAAMSGAGLMSIWLGRLVERFGAPRIMTWSGLGLFSVLFSLSLINGSTYVAILLGFLAGALGIGTGIGLYLSLLPPLFDKGLGRALGLASLGISAGVLIMPTLASAAQTAAGWRNAYRLIAVVELVGTLSMAYAVTRILGETRNADAHAHTRATKALGAHLPVLKLPGFLLLSVIFCCVTFATLGASLHLLAIYSRLDATPASFPLLLVALGSGTLVGRVGSGFLLDYLPTRAVASFAFVAGGFALTILAQLTRAGAPELFVLPLLIGLAVGAESDILAFMARRLYGLSHYAVVYNRLLVSFYLGGIAGPLWVGFASDRFHSLPVVVLPLAAACYAAAALIWLVPVGPQPCAIDSAAG